MFFVLVISLVMWMKKQECLYCATKTIYGDKYHLHVILRRYKSETGIRVTAILTFFCSHTPVIWKSENSLPVYKINSKNIFVSVGGLQFLAQPTGTFSIFVAMLVPKIMV